MSNIKNQDKFIIRFEAFEKWYGKHHAIGPLDLNIRRGEIFSLLGPNGSGKSTAIKALVGLHFPSKGRIVVNGFNVAEQSPILKRMLSYIPQRVTMPGLMTAREILTLFAQIKDMHPERVEEVLGLVSLQNDADRSIKEFSGGMVQRVGLATVFLSEPELLVLDEPTLNLDPLGRETFRDLILSLKEKGSTVIMSSHIMQEAELLADRVGILVDGKMVSVMQIPEFRESISLETSMRIILLEGNKTIPIAAENAGATFMNWEGNDMLFKAPPNRRLDILRAIENSGGVIREFHSDPPDWDMLLKKQFNVNREN